MSDANAAQIALDAVSKSFPTKRGERLALEGVSFSVAAGETATVLGPTGCGKTTVLNIVAGFDAPTRGRVLVGGKPIDGPAPDRGFMFQRPTLLPWLSVFDNVAFPCRFGRGIAQRRLIESIDAAVTHALASVGLQDAAELFPHQMSGGMQSRAALARLLVADSDVLLMDEPFAALDAQTRLSMQTLLRRVVKADRLRTVLFITHDVEEALLISDHVYLMSASPGRILRHVEVPFDGRENYRDVVSRPEFHELKHELIDQLERLVPA
jgi:ABC-type nitrate/sulfonate/bicarbonate transport system ATPase subunit